MLRKAGIVVSSVALAAALVPGAALAAEEIDAEEPSTTSALTVQAENAEVVDADEKAESTIETAAAGEQTISMTSVTNGTADLISVKLPSGTTKTAAELQSAGTSEEAYYSNGVLKAPASSTITMKFTPARGYQLTTNSICKGTITVTADDDDDHVGYYTFTMPTTS